MQWSAIGFCNNSDLVLITVAVAGPPRALNEESENIPAGLSYEDIHNADKIGNWLQERTNLRYLDKHTWKNKKGKFTMATIVMGLRSIKKISRKLSKWERDQLRRFIKHGWTNEQLARVFEISIFKVSATRTRLLHASFQNLDPLKQWREQKAQPAQPIKRKNSWAWKRPRHRGSLFACP